MTKIKARKSSPSRIKIGRTCEVVALLVLNVVAILVLAPTYRRLQEAEERDDAPRGLASSGEYLEWQERLQRSRGGPSNVAAPPRVRRPADTSPSGGGVPFIGEEAFDERYSSKYTGLLPSSGRESPDPSCGKSPDFFDFFLLPKSERSRFHEDKIIYDLFKNDTPPASPDEGWTLPKGTYLELGAFDGREESNTMFFDRCLGWDGLLIEAQSQSYQSVIRNRPHAVKMSFSPTCKDEDDVAKFYDYPMSNNGMEGLAKSYSGKETIEVPCGPLTPVLLDVFGPDGGVSFLSLDVEGAELMVLETIDFDVVHVEVIMVEIQNIHCPEANCPGVHRIRRHMAATGKYALFVDFLEASDVYVRWGSPAWTRAKAIQTERREALERRMREEMMQERQQLIGR